MSWHPQQGVRSNHSDDLALARVDAVIADGPFSADWASLQKYEPPLWYRDAKFGIFIHWGVFSVPAFENEWYPRSMYLEGTRAFEHHLKTYGPQDKHGYKDFIPSFDMARFDPDDWALLFRRAGAQFVVPVAEHHDGFAMYDTSRSRWKSTAMGPCRDVFGDLADACRAAWLTVGASSHRAEHWFFMNGGARFASDVLDPHHQDFYGPAQREETAPNEQFLEDWLLRTVEIIDGIRPQILYFDWWIESPAFEPYLRRLAAYYYNSARQWQREVVINYKWDAFAPRSAVYDIERGAIGEISPHVWQNDTALSRVSWSFVEEQEYKSVAELVAELADVVSKNGNLLLNIGPKADGTIPAREIELLLGIGSWLSTNGEAIYGTRPWVICGEGPTQVEVGSFVDARSPQYTPCDIRFTKREHVTGDYVYAIVLKNPPDGTARIRAWGRGAGLLTREVREVTVLGSQESVAWEQSPEQLIVRVPPLGQEPLPVVIKVRLHPPTKQERIDFLHG